MTKLPADLMEILACPLARTPVVQVCDWVYSTDPETRRRYPIEEGIAVMLIDRSEVVEPDEFHRVMAEAEQAGEPVARIVR